ncbi:thioesterase domain-containing protein [Bradyrhizobium sp. CCBAU 11434]|uniref:thioesterase domain-containing protein n=1 Tax=Bradyrhizobium sp. CCBAU 11434 TaxID=1630885 RepID=UPI002305141D|nr:thioesterase domain-containing protein [Bradyrhizobium sp. CCBAU 11434]
MAAEIDADCPVYALPWPPFDDVRPPTLEAVAAEVILAIKQIQPRGPYRFAGYSSGAILAYAIAEQLLSGDEVVSFMAFIDVSLPEASSNGSLKNLAREFVLDRCGILRDAYHEILERDCEQASISELLEKAQQIGALAPDARYDHIAFRRSRSKYISSMRASLSSVIGSHLTNNSEATCQTRAGTGS